MDKLEYFLWCINEGLYLKRDWILSVFCVRRDYPHIENSTYVGQLVNGPNKDIYYFHGVVDGKRTAVPINGGTFGVPLVGSKEKITLNPGDLPIVKTKVETQYGAVFANACILMYAFGDKFEYTTTIFGGWFEKILEERLLDNIVKKTIVNGIPSYRYTTEGEDPSAIYVHEYLKYGEACLYLSSFSQHLASSGSLKAITVDDSVIALRDKLLEKYKNQLHDRTTQALIQEELVKADKASFENDPAKDFHISKKAYNPTRLKALILIGQSEGFGEGGKGTYIPKSLNEKWDKKNIPAFANEARSGSYNRGKETQNGGSDVKLAYRMAFDTKVQGDYCGTTKGVVSVIRENNAKLYHGLYVVGSKGPIPITKDNIKSFYDKPILVHSPQYCKSPGSTYCKVCLGKTYSRLGNGLPAMIANIGDVFMYDKMKRMHGKAMVTARWDYQLIIY